MLHIAPVAASWTSISDFRSGGPTRCKARCGQLDPLWWLTAARGHLTISQSRKSFANARAGQVVAEEKPEVRSSHCLFLLHCYVCTG